MPTPSLSDADLIFSNFPIIVDGLKQYFSQFGKVNHCLIMRDLTTGRSRGFAFLTFDDPKSVNSVMVKEHFLDGKMVCQT